MLGDERDTSHHRIGRNHFSHIDGENDGVVRFPR